MRRISWVHAFSIKPFHDEIPMVLRKNLNARKDVYVIGNRYLELTGE